MASELKDRLTDLADLTPAGAPPPDLWARGVRRRRVSQVGRSVLVAALVLVLGVGAWSWQTSPQRDRAGRAARHPAPAGPGLRAEPVAAGVRRPAGTPGRGASPRRRSRLLHASTTGLVGITASAGEYGFLDLPERRTVTVGVRRSATGRLPGRAVRRLLVHRPAELDAQHRAARADGRRGADLRRGDRRPPERRSHVEHGLGPDALLWTDTRTLALDFGLITGANGSSASRAVHDYRLEAWRLDATGPEHLTSPALRSVTDGQFSTPGNGWLVAWGSSVRLVDPRHPERVLTASADPGTGGVLAVSPDLSRVARATDQEGPAQLQVGRLRVVPAGPAPPTRFRTVGSGRSSWPMVWTGSHRARGPQRVAGRRRHAAELDRVDARTGTSTTARQGRHLLRLGERGPGLRLRPPVRATGARRASARVEPAASLLLGAALALLVRAALEAAVRRA